MKRYSAVLFDLFDTLVDFDRERMPWFQTGNKVTWATGPLVHEELKKRGHSVSFEAFESAALSAYRDIESLRNQEYREYPSRQRMEFLLKRLGLPATDSGLVQRLVEIHMEQMLDAMIFLPERNEVLQSLRPKYRLGLVSNFDHAQTVHKALARGGFDRLLEVTAISDEVGWRKPNRKIFEYALERINLAPKEVLFVGDNYECDVEGASALGMDVAWYIRGGEDPTGRPVEARYILGNFPELRDLLPV